MALCRQLPDSLHQHADNGLEPEPPEQNYSQSVHYHKGLLCWITEGAVNIMVCDYMI